MTHIPYPGCYCADCVEGTPSARITGDKDRSVQSRAPTQRIIILTEANCQLAIECHRLRGVLRWIAEVAYVDQHSGNQNFEYLQSVARDGLAQGMSAEGQDPQGLGATPASPVRQDAPVPMGDNRHD